jgi:hypothetical protein
MIPNMNNVAAAARAARHDAVGHDMDTRSVTETSDKRPNDYPFALVRFAYIVTRILI